MPEQLPQVSLELAELVTEEVCAVDDVEKTQATRSSVERSRTRSSGTEMRTSGRKPAAWKIASSPLGEVLRKPRPARRSGPR
jgi:hypothetical protein